MHFPAGKLPDFVVDAYWSVILVGVPDYRVVPNDLKRYNFNNHRRLQKEADGSLKIAIGPKPDCYVCYELAAVGSGQAVFADIPHLTVPREAAQKCEWTPPPLEKVS